VTANHGENENRRAATRIILENGLKPMPEHHHPQLSPTGGRHRRARPPARPVLATAAAIGGAGVALAASGAAFWSAAPVANAEPTALCSVLSLASSCGASTTGAVTPLVQSGPTDTVGVGNPLGILIGTALNSPILNLVGAVPSPERIDRQRRQRHRSAPERL
jgi:hypothetical protein